MENLRNLFKNALENNTLKKETQNACKEFELKTFAKEFYNLKTIASLTSPLLSCFSVITGFGLLFYAFVSALGFVLALGFAVVLLIVLELVKSELAKLFFFRVYVSGLNSLNFVLCLFFLSCFGLSVFLSVQGAKTIYKNFDTSLLVQTKNAQIKNDSLAKYYDTQIKNEKKELENFKNSVSYLGKINIYDKTTSTTIDKHTQNISNLQSQKSKELDKLNTAHAKNENTLTNEISFNVLFWLILSLTNEFIIIVCIWFVVFYKYKVYTEKNTFGLNDTKEFTLTEKELQTYFNNQLQYLSSNIFAGAGAGAGANNESVLAKLETLQNEITSLKNETKLETLQNDTKIGFVPKNKENNENNGITKIVTKIVNEHKICKNCGAGFGSNHKKQIYCSDKCRVDFWQRTNDKKLNFKK